MTASPRETNKNQCSKDATQSQVGLLPTSDWGINQELIGQSDFLSF